MADVESELYNLKHENQQLKYKLAITEDATKSLFLRIDGLSELNNENLIERTASTLSLTGVQCNAADIDHVHRIGRFKQGHTRSISVRFLSEGKRNAILYSRANLGKSNNSNHIWINDDVSEETQRLRKTTRDVAALAKINGCNSIKVHSDGLILDNVKYKHSDLDLLPLGYSVEKAKTRDDGDNVYFQGESSPLSNFFPAKFADEDGRIFYSAEQAFQHSRAKFHEKNLIANKIAGTRNPQEIKRLSKMITSNKEWIVKEQDVLQSIVLRKFQQNPELAKRLLSTGTKQLHEATGDPKWGTGADLSSKAVLNTTWQGSDIMGSLLEKVRNQIVANQLIPPQTVEEDNLDLSTLHQPSSDDQLSPMPDDNPIDACETGGKSIVTQPTAPSPRAMQARASTQVDQGKGTTTDTDLKSPVTTSISSTPDVSLHPPIPPRTHRPIRSARALAARGEKK